MIRVPEKISATLPSGTIAGSVCDRPVNLLSLFPTLIDLTGLPAHGNNDGPSLLPLLRDPDSEWDHVSVTYLADRGSFGISATDWRYIHYLNGDEELYDIRNDPYEWANLAPDPTYAEKLAGFRGLAPTEFAEKIPPSPLSLDSIPWIPAGENEVPRSNPDGANFSIVIMNQREIPV